MKQNIDYKYIGLFIEFEMFNKQIADIKTNNLYKVIKNPHVTISYKPEFVEEGLFGEEVTIRIVGYGNDGINEGLKVELITDNEVIKKQIKEIKVPHITLSIAENGHAVDTYRLDFEPIEPIEITGIYGGFSNSEEVITDLTEKGD